MADAAAALTALREARALSDLDWHFARTLSDIAGENDDVVRLAAALVSRAVAQGHVCLDLAAATGEVELVAEDGEPLTVRLPAAAQWHTALAASAVAGPPASAAPLVLDGDRLYSRRYWRYETRFAELVRARCTDVEPALTATEIAAALDRLFGAPAEATDWQRVAAVVALHRRLCIVSGGPGTGKTFTVAKILALLAENHRRATGGMPAVVLVAPTGKAANRLGESLRETAPRLVCDEEVRELLRGKPMTIHRALGRRARTRTGFVHDESNPLRADVLVVDEASMVDVALMARLFAALRPPARVILLGDRDQLASVEAGAILADLCGDGGGVAYSRAMAARIGVYGGGATAAVPAATTVAPLADSVVVLSRNYRYGGASGIGQAATAINRGDAAALFDILDSPKYADVSLAAPIDRDGDALMERIDGALAGLFKAQDIAERLRALTGFRVLCAVRRGPFGVEQLNRVVEARFRAAGWIEGEREFYPGRPIMVVQNDAETRLFNGDVAVVAESSGEMRACFPDPDGVRLVSPGRLPSHETVYATTIHKSQGSEFDEVAVVLPDKASPLLTRELLYTAVTRARGRVTIHATPEIVSRAVQRRVERASGLPDRLWGS